MNNKDRIQLNERPNTVEDGGVDMPVRRTVQRRGFPVFYTIYFSVIALVLVASIFGLKLLYDVLGEYESVQPKYTAQQIFDEYFADPDITQLIEMSGAEYATFESHDEVVKYLAAQLESKTITYAESSAKGDAGTRSYNVFCDGTRFSTFTIKESESATDHGFTTYELGQVRLTFSLPGNSYNFLIPDGYTLYANGVVVGEKYIAGDAITTNAYKLTEGKLGVKYTPYTVSGFLSAPTFEVKDKGGETAELSYNEEQDVSVVGAGSITVMIPEGYVAYLGDAAITDQYKIADSGEASVLNAFLAEGVPGINYVKYVVDGFIDIPTVTAKSPDGVECKVVYQEDGVIFEVMPAYSEQLRAEHEAWIIEAFETTVLYLQNVKGSKADMRAYFDTSSAAWKGYNSINPNWNFEALTYSFEDESVTDFISYDADHFSCRVHIHYIGRRKNATYEETTDKIVFFRRSGDKFLIYNISNTEAVMGLGVEN